MKYMDENGKAVYMNIVDKGHGLRYIVKAASGQMLKGRDGERMKSRTFKTEHHADDFLKRNGYTITAY